jgi:octaprenyl-diphosphate synthase
MSLSFDLTVQSLARSAEALADTPTSRTLEDVRELLDHDMERVEQMLEAAVQSHEEPATRAALHLTSLGGKRIRPTTLLLSAACFGPIAARARELAVVVELVHTATLLHDDVIDDGTERRGAPAPRVLWGNALSVLAGDALLVQAMERTQTHAPELMVEFLTTLRCLVSGEIVQFRGRHQVDTTQATYERILRDKTASLFRFAGSAGAALADAPASERSSLMQFGEHLGMAFQFVDDVLDYTSNETGKTLHADLVEGKITLPLALAARVYPEIGEWIGRVRDGERDLIDAIKERVVQSGACEQVRARAERETDLAISALQGVRACPARALLESIAGALVTRDA